MKHELLFRRFFASLLLLAVSTHSWAYDFEVNGIYYNKNSDGKSVEVTYKSESDRGYSGSVTIPSSVTYEGTTYNVTSIGYAAFFDCSGLTSINIPESVTSIGDYAFNGCKALTKAEFASIESLCKISFDTDLSNPLSAAHHLYVNGDEVKNLVIPNSVTHINDYAFVACSGLTSITIPNGVTSIGSSAFSGCSGLTSVTIPNSVTSIRTHAFDGCSGLTSINIPSSVTSIYIYAFEGCSGLTSIVVDANNKRYDSRNGCNAIIETSSNRLITGCKNTVIPESVTEIYNYAFYNCSGLTSITIPESVTSIGEGAFRDCSGLTSINIPESVTSISYSAFYGCTSLPVIDNIRYADTYLVGAVDKTNSTYNIKEGTRFIGGSAFRRCSNLMSVTIPNSVTSIGSYAFEGCSGLTSITIPESVTSIDYGVFSDCSGLTSVTINSNAIVSKSYGYSYVDPEGMQRLFGEQVREYIIGDGVTCIGSYAFAGCSNLTSITIPESVTSVESSAFRDCPNLPVIDNIRYADTYLVGAVDKTQSTYNIKDGTRFIGDNAFVSCSGFTSITIPKSVMTIGANVFAGCPSLPVIDNIRYADTYLVEAVDQTKSTYSIKEGTRFIGDNAFDGCSGLTSITIPESVTSIGLQAFFGCSALTSITIPESVTNIGFAAFCGCSALTSVTCLVTKSDRSTDGIVEPVEPRQPVKPLPGVDPATLTSADYLYPFNPAHPDNPSTDNYEETVEVTAQNVYPEEECKQLWLDYYKKLFNNRQATSRRSSKWNSLSYNPYIRRKASELVLMHVYQFEWSRYIADLDYFEYGYARELAGYNCLKRLGYYPMPSTNGLTFENVPLSDATLYVHEDVIDAYKVTAPWSGFGRILTIESTAVDELKAKAPQEEGDTDAPIYDLMGRRLSEKPAKGYYVQGGKIYFVK